MRLKLFRRAIFYGMIGGLYLIGYCKGYDDGKQKRDAMQQLYQKGKTETLNTLDEATDTAYKAVKKIIKQNRGE